MKKKVNSFDAGKLTRRSLILGASQIGIIAGLGMRMQYLQVDKSEEYKLLADQNRIDMIFSAPPRGLIYDRNGLLLAQNLRNYRVVATKSQIENIEETLESLSRLIPISDEVREETLKRIEKNKRLSIPVMITDNLTWEQVSKVEANTLSMPGISAELGYSRAYPSGSLYGHVLGYVGRVSQKDLDNQEDPDPLLNLQNFQVGKTGVEDKKENDLRGKAGAKRVEVNAHGRIMRELGRTEGLPGKNIQLTVDTNLQKFVLKRLSQVKSGSAVVMDVLNGDLVALASSPTFDPNLFVNGISYADYKKLNEDPLRPMYNKFAAGTYPPGSTFKMVVALAALEDKKITPYDTIHCKGHIEISGNRFHCWNKRGHGSVNLKRSLKHSCDVYYYTIAKRVGIEKITKMANKLGLGIQHDIPVSAVKKGLTPTKKWKQENRELDWVVGDTINSGIGQGFVLASPLQLAIMAARIATGKEIKPRLIRTIGNDILQVPEPRNLDINPKHLKIVQRGMYAVSNEGGGTAYKARIKNKNMQLAGKTGTSQVRRITRAERKRGVFRNSDLPWKRRDHALFVCYAPYSNPKYAVSVIVEHGGGGSKIAAPIARDIMIMALSTPDPKGPNQQNDSDKKAIEEAFLRGDYGSYTIDKVDI